MGLGVELVECGFKLPVPHAGIACRTLGQPGAQSLSVRCQENPGSSRGKSVRAEDCFSGDGQEQGAARHTE